MEGFQAHLGIMYFHRLINLHMINSWLLSLLSDIFCIISVRAFGSYENGAVWKNMQTRRQNFFSPKKSVFIWVSESVSVGRSPVAWVKSSISAGEKVARPVTSFSTFEKQLPSLTSYFSLWLHRDIIWMNPNVKRRKKTHSNHIWLHKLMTAISQKALAEWWQSQSVVDSSLF